MMMIFFLGIGLLIGFLFSWIFNEKGFIMYLSMAISIGGALIGGNTAHIIFDSGVISLLSALIGAVCFLLFGVALLIHLTHHKRKE